MESAQTELEVYFLQCICAVRKIDNLFYKFVIKDCSDREIQLMHKTQWDKQLDCILCRQYTLHKSPTKKGNNKKHLNEASAHRRHSLLSMQSVSQSLSQWVKQSVSPFALSANSVDISLLAILLLWLHGIFWVRRFSLKMFSSVSKLFHKLSAKQ